MQAACANYREPVDNTATCSMETHALKNWENINYTKIFQHHQFNSKLTTQDSDTVGDNIITAQAVTKCMKKPWCSVLSIASFTCNTANRPSPPHTRVPCYVRLLFSSFPTHQARL